MLSKKKTNVFISYSWDNSEHEQWVLSLADIINSRGGNAILDRTHLKYGGHIKTFMLKSIMDADVVLMILTPNYKNKADNLLGGAGYEYNIINNELFKIIKSNEKYIPVLRLGSFETSVTSFLQEFFCIDLRESLTYNERLDELLDRILSDKYNQPITNKQNKLVMGDEYKDLKLVAKEMIEKSAMYFRQLFVADNEAMTKIKIGSTIKKWENEIDEYHLQTESKFNPKKMLLYEDYLEDFKNNVFGKELWTVKAALKTKDPDLARYKKDFRDADAQVIYDTINGILKATHEYVNDVIPTINISSLQLIEDLKLDYLNIEEMFMNKIIGFGIRSEILHRYYPSNFPIMTQKSLWAMYFICDSANEFITIEQRNSKSIMRVSHNWQYPYERFTFLMNILADNLIEWFKKYNILLQPKYRFGYVNMFQSMIHESHKSDIKLLHAWIETE